MNCVKLKRVKIALVLFLIMLTVLVCSSCDFYGMNEKGCNITGMTAMSYAIPGAYTEDSFLVNIALKEKDSYGRMLFVVESGLSLPALMIVQAQGVEYVHYYDNICYLNIEDVHKYTEEQVEYLKELNDWNEELNLDKAIRRKCNAMDYELELQADHLSDCETLVADNILPMLPEGYSFKIRFCDESKSGQELYYILAASYNKNGRRDFRKQAYHYFVVIEPDGEYNPETYMLKIDDFEKSNLYLTKIKEMNGWVA